MIPTKAWRYVPTKHNPADVASRGATASELKNHPLWWHGPPWLLSQPIEYPAQPSSSILKKLKYTEIKSTEQIVSVVAPVECMEDKFNSYLRMLRVFCWIKRLGCYIRTKIKNPQIHLTAAEGTETTRILIIRSQARSFPEEVKRLTADPPNDLCKKSTILTLRPRVDDQGILRIGGRLSHNKLPEYQKHPILIAANDHYTQLLFLHYHLQLGHCGPSALLAHAGNIFHVKGGRKLAKSVYTKCVTCRMAAAKSSQQLLGQLPSERVEPNYVFLHTGIDFAGPFIIRKGHTRRPVGIKAHLAVFVCLCTKAVHLELTSDQTKEALLAAVDRFGGRRGQPLHIYSDNGPCFVGARNELARYYAMVKSKEYQEAIQNYAFEFEITWHNSPQRAPHFGGLWEAAVKSAKYHIKRIVGHHRFTYEELNTVIVKVESFLNSRPLGPVTSHDIDGLSALTPAHFLIGRSARAYPRKKVDSNPTTLERWKKCQQVSQHFWDRWSQEYLQIMQEAVKWHKKSRNFEVGDLVLLTDGNEFQCQWTMAKVIKTFPGVDGLVRTVDVQVENVIIPKGCKSKAE